MRFALTTVRTGYLLVMLSSMAAGLALLGLFLPGSDWQSALILFIACSLLIVPAARGLLRIAHRRPLLPESTLRAHPFLAAFVLATGLMATLLLVLVSMPFLSTPPATSVGGPIGLFMLLCYIGFLLSLLTAEFVLV